MRNLLKIGQIWTHDYHSVYKKCRFKICKFENGTAFATFTDAQDQIYTTLTGFAAVDNDHFTAFDITANGWYQIFLSSEAEAEEKERQRREEHAEKYL